ncbi:hypothetical protein [Wenzhouxiangella sp. EGI_FJ10305]|uniref:hypothetical protein n=1 Tax=Wenzhouxiangella sp. EGI_FJ10305 TaxID=3243768 RepID=UPI0035D62BA1
MTAAIVRTAILAVMAWAWLYCSSVFSPWAESAEPRLWLYDTLIYTGFGLVLWGAGELLVLVITRRASALPLSFVLLAAIAGMAHWLLHHADIGWQWRVGLSSQALVSYQEPVYDDQRRRVGWLLVDTQRAPCDSQAWLWLGRPFGGGTGINRALVHSPGAAPLTPQSGAFGFVRVDEDWWMAYQHPERFRPDESGSCTPGKVLPSHASGRAFIDG